MKFLGIVLLLGLGLALWIRLAPSDPARWHVSNDATDDRDMPGGAIRIVPAGPGDMARLDRIIRATPRTSVLAGAPEEGMVTYVTRSRIWGFPDYSTVTQRGGAIVIFGRLRFGSSDLGVNRARITRWIAAFDQGQGQA